jgi:hypothetical protein
MSAVIAGLFKSLSIGLESGEKQIYGPALQVDYFCTGAETPPSKAEYFLSIYREGSALMRDSLLDHGPYETQNILLRNKEEQRLKEIADSWDAFQTLFRLFAHHNGKTWTFFASVMLKGTDFDFFLRFVDRHFLADVEYLIRVPFEGFWLSVATKDDFYNGKQYTVRNEEISLVFRRSPPNATYLITPSA